jgi:orotate phosphoribosyltransferase
MLGNADFRLKCKGFLFMTDRELEPIFTDLGAFLQGHFSLSSGKHSSGYLQCALVLQYPEVAGRLGTRLGEQLRRNGYAPKTVVSPALGGLIIGYEVARALGARFLFVERTNGPFSLRRGFSLSPGEEVAVVEDVITTGLSTRECVQVAEQAGAKVVCAASLVDRSGGKAEVGCPSFSLWHLSLPAWDPEECSLCQQGLPCVKPGSRK